MRILYIDVDSLRPDHLGCYGYHRATSPNIDAIAADAVRFTNVYASDVPCLPSRTALFSGRFGFRTGVVNHGKARAMPFNEGDQRGDRDSFGETSWMVMLREAGYHTASISSFAQRHAAWHWNAGFKTMYVPEGKGLENANAVAEPAIEWLSRYGKDDNWFLHVNFWDPHTPYRTPDDFGNPFVDDPIPEWLTEDVWRRGWEGYGPHTPQEIPGFTPDQQMKDRWPKHPIQLPSMDAVKAFIDGYDCGVRYADDYIGRLLNHLADMNLLTDTAIIISADHGENLAELNVWGDHQTADEITCHLPLIIRWPGMDVGRTDDALHYQFDMAATVLDLLDIDVPANWDGESFASAFKAGEQTGRDYLVMGQGTWSVQRGVRFQQNDTDYLMIRTYHDGYKMLDPLLLFNLTDDPHEQHNLADDQPDLITHGKSLLDDWHTAMMDRSDFDVDPLMTVLREGGPFYVRGKLPAYLERLRATGRTHHAETLAKLHPEAVK